MSVAVDVAAERLGDRCSRGVMLGPFTTYRVGGPAALFIEARTDDDLVAVADAVIASGLEVLVVGNGSNLLVADAGFDGIALRLGETYATVDITGTRVRAGGSALLPVVARRTAAAGLRGFEWAVGVPGSIGGAVRMNAGGHGSDMASVLVRVRLFDLHTGDDGEMSVDDLALSYRSSSVAASQVVLWAELRLRVGERDAAEAEIAEIVRWRRANQPGGPNAGSVFTNPPGDSAGRLVEAAGCKGWRVGSAEVSRKHANFIQVDEGGAADDVWALMQQVRAMVAERTGVQLVAETRTVGFDEPAVEVEG